jgi:FAD:protein FMN transferase
MAVAATAPEATAPVLARHRFASMGTWVECLVEAPSSPALKAALDAVEREFGRLERMLSRFRADSELSRLNRERAVEDASDELLELTALALDARERTGGRFDPTLHDALVAAGYDRTFDELTGAGAPAVDPSGGGDVTITGSRIELGRGASLDLGGIAKGYAADRCVATLATFGPALVNAGGDLAISGPRADGPWPIGVAVPAGTLTLALERGGLATSGRDRRRWRHAGEERHHLIDPSTLRPAEGGPVSVTVAAESATEAEVRAKELFLARNPETHAKRTGAAAVVVSEAGDVRLVGMEQ